jgi:hypothetical protein
MAPLRVRGYTREDALHWDRFVELCPDATFFHRSGWKEALASERADRSDTAF